MNRLPIRLLPLAAVLIASPVLFATDPGVPSGNSVVVEAGETGHNDDIMVVNSSQQLESDAKARITPKSGGADKNSTVNTQGGFMGTISGVEAGDSVTIGANSGDENQPDLKVNVIGTGGNVTIGNDCNVQVTNLGGPGSSDILVTLPSGGEPTPVPPGTSHPFGTF